VRVLSFVGRLEHFDDDWRWLRKRDCALPPIPAFSSALDSGAHSETSDHRFRDELEALLVTTPSMRRAMCRLLEPDYVCFGYNLSACLRGHEANSGTARAAGAAQPLRTPGEIALDQTLRLSAAVGLAVLALLGPVLALACRRDRRGGRYTSLARPGPTDVCDDSLHANGWDSPCHRP